MSLVRPEVVVVRTGTANTASVLAGLERAGARPAVDNQPARAAAADFLVLPGVGSLGAAMERLAADDLVAALAERIRAGRPTLAVCLGLQLLCEGSQESPGVAGLGVLAGQATRFPDGVTVPQMGWNRIQPGAGCALLRAGWAYFANSYRLQAAPDGWAAALAEHGGPFVAALERGPVLACQFHPELSGAWGLALLQRWLGTAGGEVRP
jgi:imidazole glycerol phosphate synthase glutamine amidotransferase subunit